MNLLFQLEEANHHTHHQEARITSSTHPHHIILQIQLQKAHHERRIRFRSQSARPYPSLRCRPRKPFDDSDDVVHRPEIEPYQSTRLEGIQPLRSTD